MKLSDLIRTETDIASVVAHSQFAMHALSRDKEGLLTYTKAMWANSAESIAITAGPELAYNNMEEFISGYTPTGTLVNNTDIYVNENPNRVINSKTYYVKVINGAYVVDGLVRPNLILEKGVNFTFDISDTSTQGFSLYISTSPGDSARTNEYNEGVSYIRLGVANSAPTSLNFTVPFNAPNILYYSCVERANCFGTLHIAEAKVDISRRKYEQVRFDSQRLIYYVNENGFLVARYGSDYSYT
jgi:hypothetical protein